LRFLFSLYIVLLPALTVAQTHSRIVVKINEGWIFSKEIKGGNPVQWQPITIPHTWNLQDVVDDIPGYYRGVGVYKRKLFVDKKLQGKQLYLFFEGVNQVAEIYINGKKAGNHIGGYSGFYVPVTALIMAGEENEIVVRSDNSFDRNIAPLSADFTFYGGIYRDVFLVAVEPLHFSMNENGSNAVYISTPSVTKTSAKVHIKAIVSNEGKTTRKIRIWSTIFARSGRIVAVKTTRAFVEQGDDKTILQEVTITHPDLWSPEAPQLYRTVTEIIDDETGKLLDAVNNPLGLRWFHFDAEKGFFLNGKPYKLVGTSRHQDYQGLGNAVPDETAVKDVQWLKQMGGNFLRIAHYPQDPCILRACDSLGILASVEIPIVNEITESDSFTMNCRNMQLEMIRQNYNHPSVIIWCYMNEVLLRPHYNDDKIKQGTYFTSIARLARMLDSITRAEDPHRYTMMAHHGDYNKYRDVGLLDIPMIVGWNLYSGWYGAKLSDFPAFLDSFHKKHPMTPLVVSEYGADADPRISSLEPVRFDKSVEYTTRFHQYYLEEMLKRPFVSAAMVWNLADFNSETRNESMPHINNKGLLTWDRIPKDAYYYYQAILSKIQFVKILGRKKMAGVIDSIGNCCTRSIQVASNLPDLLLKFNGKELGWQKNNNGLFEWRISFVDGPNEVEVKGMKNGKTVMDKSIIQFDLQPEQLAGGPVKFRQLNILLGSKRFFTDSCQQVWIPDQPYKTGSWGYIGGHSFKAPGNNRLPYGTDKNIIGTDDDPVYQTQQTGIQKYKLDLPAGEYEVTCYFAELSGSTVKGLPYNINDPDRIEPNGKRIFDVFVNDSLLLDKFNIAAEYGPATAVSKKIKLRVTNSRGIEIRFNAIEGEPVLNALQVKKLEAGEHPTASAVTPGTSSGY
jgi:beta-galactosidase